MSKKVFHVHLSAPTFKNKGISKGFVANGFQLVEFNWQKSIMVLGLNRTQGAIIREASESKPDLIFIHTHKSTLITVDMVKVLMGIAPTVFFYIDARMPEQMAWLYELNKHCTHVFYSNKNDIDECNKIGIRNCSVLQSSCDYSEYFPLHKDESLNIPPIVFIGTKTSKYPLSAQRAEMVDALTKTYGEKFKAYGLGFSDGYINVEKEREIFFYSCGFL